MTPSGAPRESPISSSDEITRARCRSSALSVRLYWIRAAHQLQDHNGSVSNQFASRWADVTCEFGLLNRWRPQDPKPWSAGGSGTAAPRRDYPSSARSGHETHRNRICHRNYCPRTCEYVRVRTRRSERPGIYHRRSRSEFRHARHIAHHGQFDEEPERKRHVYLRRQRCQCRSGQGQDARQWSAPTAERPAKAAVANPPQTENAATLRT